MAAPLERARVALEGLSVGDALGERFFSPDVAATCGPGAEPPPPWAWTDDTNMAVSIVEVLARHGHIDQDELAASFSARFDPRRDYGPGMCALLPRLGREDWRDVAGALFGGTGSYGNGAAMRVPPLGAFFADDLDRCRAEAERSAVVTHAHPEAVAGAVAVAVAAAVAAGARGGQRPDVDVLLARVVERTPVSDVRERIDRARARGPSASVASVATDVGNGSRLSAQDTVPFAVWCAARFVDDYEGATWAAISAGGDMDTVAAIVGGITASYVGLAGIPSGWRSAREPLPLVR